MTLKRRLLDFIRDTLIADSGAPPLQEGDSLIERGVIDSMGLAQLMIFIEQETGVRIPDDEVVPDNFQTVAHIEQIVQRLQARAR